MNWCHCGKGKEIKVPCTSTYFSKCGDPITNQTKVHLLKLQWSINTSPRPLLLYIKFTIESDPIPSDGSDGVATPIHHVCANGQTLHGRRLST